MTIAYIDNDGELSNYFSINQHWLLITLLTLRDNTVGILTILLVLIYRAYLGVRSRTKLWLLIILLTLRDTEHCSYTDNTVSTDI